MMSIISDPKVVLIIGNGFDLNLGLKTSYNDFIASMHFINLLNGGSLLCKHLKDKHQLQNWIDIENELKELEKTTEPSILKPEFNALCSALIDYLKSIPMAINNSSIAYNTFKDLYENDSRTLLIVDYNFTNTTQVLLRMFGSSQGYVDEHVLKIHGSLEQEAIIFGIEDSYALKHRKNIYLKKSANWIFGAHDIDNYLAKAEKIIFFGHSIGETDHSDFDYFFRRARDRGTNSGRNVTIYFHGDEGYDDIQSQLDILTLKGLGNFIRFNQVEFIDSSQSKRAMKAV